MDDIRVLFVQGTRELVVAQGAAGADYGFQVDVTVPVELEPGPATLRADYRIFESLSTLKSPVTIGSAPPLAVITGVSAFGPPTPSPSTVAVPTNTLTATSPSAQDPAADKALGSRRLLLATIAAVVLAAGSIFLLRQRRRR